MRHRSSPAKPAAPSLAEEKSNFTAEGAPPPGKVATTAPQTVTGSRPKEADPTRPVSGTIRLKRPSAARYP
jgi:hypothetical protein